MIWIAKQNITKNKDDIHNMHLKSIWRISQQQQQHWSSSFS